MQRLGELASDVDRYLFFCCFTLFVHKIMRKQTNKYELPRKQKASFYAQGNLLKVNAANGAVPEQLLQQESVIISLVSEQLSFCSSSSHWEFGTSFGQIT